MGVHWIFYSYNGIETMWEVLAHRWWQGKQSAVSFFRQIGKSRVVVTRRAGKPETHWECYLTGDVEVAKVVLHSTNEHDAKAEAVGKIVELLEAALEDLKQD